MICVLLHMQPFHTHCFTYNGIEAVSTTLLLSNKYIPDPIVFSVQIA